jgi:hypothetical protein
MKSNVEVLADRIEELVRKRDWLSFVELRREIPETDGDMMYGDDRLNLFIGFGLTNEAIDALMLLRSENRVLPVPGSFMSYMVDGGVAALPIATRIPRRGYKTPHWTPCFLRLMSKFDADEKAEKAEKGKKGKKK